MRFGCCVNMHATRASRIGEEWLPLLKRAGFDYVELPLAEITALDSASFETFCGDVSAAGIPCESMNNLFPPVFSLTGPAPDSAQTILDYVERAFSRARSLGAEVVVFGSGAAKRSPDGFSLREARKQLFFWIRKIDLLAAKYHLTIALEPLNQKECNLINTFKEGSRWIAEAKTSQTKVLVDTYHMCLEQESPFVVAHHPGQLAHVHISSPFTADGMERRIPSPNDGWDFGPLREALRRVGYQERISIEAFSNDLVAEAEPSLQYLRHIFS